MMNNLSKYMSYIYSPGARGEEGLIDCWGLVRVVRAEVFGKSLLPEFAQARMGDSKQIQAAFEKQRSELIQVAPCEVAIAACIRRGVCIHVAILVSKDHVLEIKRAGARARLQKLSDSLLDYPAPLWEVQYFSEVDEC